MEEIVSFENVYYIREGKEILKGIDWKIYQDQAWALLGLNGSGKTSLLSMIPAYTNPSSGRVKVLGQAYGSYNWNKMRKRLGFVSSKLNAFLPAMERQTCLGVIRSGASGTFGFYHDLSDEGLARSVGLAESFGLADHKDQSFASLSQGQQRRALLARAFLGQPDLLVLDEPCTGLDLRAREELLASLEAMVQEEGTSLIYVTHNIDEIIPAISHVAIMDEGQLSAQGTKEEVLTQSNLESLYQLDLDLEEAYSRYWLKVRPKK